jgi:hypothetical protein
VLRHISATIFPVRAALKIIVWVGVILFGILAVLMMTGALDGPGQDAAGRGMSAGFGFLLGLVAVAGASALLLAQRWRGWFVVAAIIVGLPLILAVLGLIGSGVGQMKNHRYQKQLHSGEIDFSDQPALLAVALAINRNDENAIRSAAKALLNLQATNKDGKTLLYFAVDEAIEPPELVKAVQTLLSSGADPNYTNEHFESYALAQSTHGPLALLKVMIDAGGNPNAKDSQGKPIIFCLWATIYHPNDRAARLDLLLDRGADINSALPNDSTYRAGYSLVMERASGAIGEAADYSEALHLLQRGADFRHTAPDGATLASILAEHRKSYTDEHKAPPPEYNALYDWLNSKGEVVRD